MNVSCDLRIHFLTSVANDLMVNYIETKRLVINIHKTYPLAEAALSHADLESRGTTGKLVLEIPQ